MATMNVSLPDPMKDWVEAQATTGRYSNASDYVRDLVRRDQARMTRLLPCKASLTPGSRVGLEADRRMSCLPRLRLVPINHEL